MSYLDSVMLGSGNFTQAFVDYEIIEASQELTKTSMNRRRIGKISILGKDKPWEYVLYFTCSNHVVRRDSRSDGCHCQSPQGAPHTMR